MLHKTELGDHGETFPHDKAGYVPVHHDQDNWREMQFDHADMDPNAEGISPEEHARRLEYLDTQWWPQVLEKVNAERQRLEEEHGETFIKHWQRVVNRHPHSSHGFSAE